MSAFSRVFAFFGATLASGCATSVGDSIDRTGFALQACPSGAQAPFAGLTPSTPVDYLELRRGADRLAARGVVCGAAVDPVSCRARAASATVEDAWAVGPDGAIPAQRVFLVFTRGDEVGAVGVRELASFLAPVENPSDAAFLAEVATLGTVDCTKPSVREVTGGFEVITTTTDPCGGQVTESLTFVASDGTATVRQQVETVAGSGGECA
jgi:hypothetical protein